MAPSDGSTAVATLSLISFVAFQLVGGYATFKIIQNRQCLHIVNRNLAIVLSNQLIISVCNFAITMRWYALAKGHTESYPALKVIGRLGISQCLTVIPAEELFKMYVLVLKFKDRVGNKIWDVGDGNTLVRCFLPDLRTARGQRTYIAGAHMLSLVLFALHLGAGDHLCIHVCRGALPVFGSTWIITLPVVAFLCAVIGRILWELHKLGHVEELLGIFQEMKDLVIFVGFFNMAALTILFLVDLELLPPHLDWLAASFFLCSMWGFQIISHVRLCSDLGYGKGGLSAAKVVPFVLPSVVNDRLVRQPTGSVYYSDVGDHSESESHSGSKDRSTSRQQPAVGVVGSSLRGRKCGGVLLLVASAFPEGIEKDPEGVQSLYTLARMTLVEEAVRCVITISELMYLSTKKKEDRDKMRDMWRTIVMSFLRDGADYPVSIGEHKRRRLCNMVTKARRRIVVFMDDCDKINAALEAVVRELSPVVAPVLAMYEETRHLSGIVGEVGSPVSRRSSGSRGSLHSRGSREMNDSRRERSSSGSSVSSVTATDRHPHVPEPDMAAVGVGIDQPEPTLTSGRGDGKSRQRLSGVERREEGAAGSPPPRDPSSPTQALLWESRGSNRSTDSEMEALTGPRLAEREAQKLPPLIVKGSSPKDISPIVHQDGGPLPWGSELPVACAPDSEQGVEALAASNESLGPDVPGLRADVS